jgi:hypothetical protein
MLLGDCRLLSLLFDIFWAIPRSQSDKGPVLEIIEYFDKIFDGVGFNVKRRDISISQAEKI